MLSFPRALSPGRYGAVVTEIPVFLDCFQSQSFPASVVLQLMMSTETEEATVPGLAQELLGG